MARKRIKMEKWAEAPRVLFRPLVLHSKGNRNNSMGEGSAKIVVWQKGMRGGKEGLKEKREKTRNREEKRKRTKEMGAYMVKMPSMSEAEARYSEKKEVIRGAPATG
jgi:hypothetical protein